MKAHALKITRDRIVVSRISGESIQVYSLMFCLVLIVTHPVTKDME